MGASCQKPSCPADEHSRRPRADSGRSAEISRRSDRRVRSTLGPLRNMQNDARRNLREKVALLTSGSRGVGREIAEELGELGPAVYVTGRSVEQATLGGGRIPIKCDHRDDE